MVEFITPLLAPRRADAAPAAVAEPTPGGGWLAAMLDQVDYGMLLVTPSRTLMHANKAAQRELAAEHPLLLGPQQVQARSAQDAALLEAALHDAAWRGRRCLLRLGQGAKAHSLAVVPLEPGNDGTRAVLLMLGRQQVCEDLSVENFARTCRLTTAETQVLRALCAGHKPLDIAKRQGVALSTVRTQIGSIRAKTGAASMRSLLAQVAQLPPMVTALHGVRVAPRAA